MTLCHQRTGLFIKQGQLLLNASVCFCAAQWAAFTFACYWMIECWWLKQVSGNSWNPIVLLLCWRHIVPPSCLRAIECWDLKHIWRNYSWNSIALLLCWRHLVLPSCLSECWELKQIWRNCWNSIVLLLCWRHIVRPSCLSAIECWELKQIGRNSWTPCLPVNLYILFEPLDRLYFQIIYEERRYMLWKYQRIVYL